MPHLLHQQILLDAGGDRSQHLLGRQVGDHRAEPGALHLAVPHLAEQGRVPGQVGIKGLGPVGVEVGGEDPQGGPEPAGRDPGGVDAAEAAAKCQVTFDQGVVLLCQVGADDVTGRGLPPGRHRRLIAARYTECFRDLVRAGRGGGAGLGEPFAEHGERVLRPGGAEFGLDLPPAGQRSGPRPGATASTWSSATSTTTSPAVLVTRCTVRSVRTVTMCRNAFPRRVPATRAASSFGTVVWLPVGSSLISVRASPVGTLSCHPLSASPVRHRNVIPLARRS